MKPTTNCRNCGSSIVDLVLTNSKRWSVVCDECGHTEAFA